MLDPLHLQIGGQIRVVTEIGPNAKMAAFGMKWGDKAQLDALEDLLT